MAVSLSNGSFFARSSHLAHNVAVFFIKTLFFHSPSPLCFPSGQLLHGEKGKKKKEKLGQR